MDKTFRGKISSRRTCSNSGEMALTDPESIPWPCVAGPTVPDTNPKLWKTPRLDMNSSLAFLRRELAAMQLQDRAIHKQLLALNSSIFNLKTSLNESWEIEELHESEAVSYPEPQSTQVAHVKQDSGILTDESDEECDVFESETAEPLRQVQVRSTSAVTHTKHLDTNNNDSGNPSKRNVHTNNFQAFNLSIPRTRPHTVSETQFHRVTSMPVINENPNDVPHSKVSGKAFAIYGYVKNNNSNTNSFTREDRLNRTIFHPLSRHESMPIISGNTVGSIRHTRSQTEPVQFSREPTSRVTRASSQMDIRSSSHRKHGKPYKIWRSSSQISLV